MESILEEINKKKFMTFDCYGTLIDWETGILNTIQPILNNHGVNISNENILKLYSEFESKAEQHEFVNYKSVLTKVMKMFLSKFKIDVHENENKLIQAIKQFEPFPDAIESLKKIKEKFTIGVISNVDNDLFEFSANKLKIKIPYVITSEDVSSYKPSENNFIKALEIMDAKAEDTVHVAQSVYHDILPASKLGITTVLVLRSKMNKGFGATPDLHSNPDLIISDLEEFIKIISNK
jgi:2-haloacid dehalogenase